MKTKFCLLIMCLFIYACATPNQNITMPNTLLSKSYNIWYNHNELNLALLAGFENDPATGAELGLVFLQGKRFAQCSYFDNTIKCSLSAGIKNTKLQKITEDIALTFAHILASNNALPLQWERTNAKKGHAFENKIESSTLRIEEHL